MKKKTVALLLACVMLFGAAMGGTLAWLTAKTSEVKNVFTVGDINLEISETGAADPNENDSDTTLEKNFDFVPGDTLAKDPMVTVKANSEACYLFVKVVDAKNTRADLVGDIIQWAVDTSIWTPVEGHTGYWYKIVDADTAKDGVSYYVLTGDGVSDSDYEHGKVTVNENVTKAMVNGNTVGVTNGDTGIEDIPPTITITAAAVQSANIADVATAFSKLPSDFTGISD